MKFYRAIAGFILAHILIFVYCMCAKYAHALEVIVYATQPVKSRQDVYVITSFEADHDLDDPKDGYVTKAFSTLQPDVIFAQQRHHDDAILIHHQYMVIVMKNRYELTSQFEKAHAPITSFKADQQKRKSKRHSPIKKVPEILSAIREDSKEEKE